MAFIKFDSTPDANMFVFVCFW